MYITTAQILRRYDFSGGRFDQRRTRKKNRALLFDDDRHIRHRRHIRSARRTRPHDNSDLRDALAAHPGLVIENPAKVVAVRKDFILIGQVRPTAVDQIDARQMVFFRDFLSPQVLFHTHREIGAALHCGVIAHDHTIDTVHFAHARDYPRRRGRPAVKPVCGQRPDLKKRRSRIQQICDPFTGQHLAAADMAGTGFLAAAKLCCICRFADGLQCRQMRGLVCLEAFG